MKKSVVVCGAIYLQQPPPKPPTDEEFRKRFGWDNLPDGVWSALFSMAGAIDSEWGYGPPIYPEFTRVQEVILCQTGTDPKDYP